MSDTTSAGRSLGIPDSVVRILGRLRTPWEIQDFVNSLTWNHAGGDTARSVVRVLEYGKAQCIEGAFVAACALWLSGRPPLLMDLGADRDADHVVALFRRGRSWGAISKSNSPCLRFRDPIHRTLRELALSYFPQYMNRRRKTLRSYSVPIDLRRHDPALWITHPGFCGEMVDILSHARHFQLLPRGMTATDLRPLDPIEIRGLGVKEYPKE